MESGSFSWKPQEFVKFDGCNYTQWAEKVKFLLVMLDIAYVIDPNQLTQQRMVRKFKEDEALCCGHIKKCLSNRLLDVYASFTDPRKLWDSLKHKYEEQDKGSHFSLIAKYFDFQMVDKKSVLEQVDELESIVNRLNALSIPISEAFQVGAIIAKLPPSWKDFSKMMMHETKDYSLNDLLMHICIEEEFRNRDQRVLRGSRDHDVLDENIVSRSSRGNPHKHKLGVKVDKSKKKAPQKSKITGMIGFIE